jgi:hypothetical protein
MKPSPMPHAEKYDRLIHPDVPEKASQISPHPGQGD